MVKLLWCCYIMHSCGRMFHAFFSVGVDLKTIAYWQLIRNTKNKINAGHDVEIYFTSGYYHHCEV